MIIPVNSVKLIDFGYSEILPRDPKKVTRLHGTPYYMPPEFLKNEYSNGNVSKFPFLIFEILNLIYGH